MKPRTFLLTTYGAITAGLMIALCYACTKNDFLRETKPGLSLNTSHNVPVQAVGSSSDFFNKTVGAPIEGKIGEQWIRNYRKIHTGRSDYFISTKNLQPTLKNPNCVGICMYYALNNWKETIVIPVGISGEGELLKTENLYIETGEISWNEAKAWIGAYKGAIKAHFFGSNTFERLAKDPNCQVIRASYALNTKGIRQLLLATAAESNPYVFEDESRPCPSYCPKNSF